MFIKHVQFKFSSLLKFDPSKDYYQILQISKQSQVTEIKTKYYELAKKYHPDVNKSNDQKFIAINEAYQILSNEATRREYDGQRVTKTDRPLQYKRQEYQYGNRRPQSQKSYDDFKASQYQNYQQRQTPEQDAYSEFLREQNPYRDLHLNQQKNRANLMGLLLGGFLILTVFDVILRGFMSNRDVLVVDESTGEMYMSSQKDMGQFDRKNYKTLMEQQYYEEQNNRRKLRQQVNEQRQRNHQERIKD